MSTNGNGSEEPIKSQVSLGGMLDGNQTPVQPAVVAPVEPVVVPTPQGVVTPPITTGNEPIVTPTPNVETFESLVGSLTSPTLTAELQSTKEALLSTFKATTLDANGNLLNAANEVILSADKLKAYVDNDTLPLDAQGNVVNDKGEIIQTKAELDNDFSIINPVKSALETNFGVELPADLELPDTEEGIVKLVSEVVKAKTTNTVVNFLEANPELKGFYQHIALGGKPEDYTSSNIDYKGINIKNLDEAAKTQLLAKSFSLQGTPNKENLIEIIKKAGEEELNKATASAVLFLDAKQSEFNQQREQELLEAADLEEENTEKYWQSVKSVVDKGTLGNINIPLADREAFFNYMAKPINTNYDSAESTDAAKDSLEFQLLVSYLRYKKGDISKLASIIATEQKVTTLKDRLNTLNRRTENGVPITGSNSSSGKAGTTLSNGGLDALL